jgi:hypothetical protein
MFFHQEIEKFRLMNGILLLEMDLFLDADMLFVSMIILTLFLYSNLKSIHIYCVMLNQINNLFYYN